MVQCNRFKFHMQSLLGAQGVGRFLLPGFQGYRYRISSDRGGLVIRAVDTGEDLMAADLLPGSAQVSLYAGLRSRPS